MQSVFISKPAQLACRLVGMLIKNAPVALESVSSREEACLDYSLSGRQSIIFAGSPHLQGALGHLQSRFDVFQATVSFSLCVEVLQPVPGYDLFSTPGPIIWVDVLDEALCWRGQLIPGQAFFHVYKPGVGSEIFDGELPRCYLFDKPVAEDACVEGHKVFVIIRL